MELLTNCIISHIANQFTGVPHCHVTVKLFYMHIIFEGHLP